MAYYNINEMLRLTRIAKGISQEELSFGICTPATLSGYETGKHTVKRTTYRKLMERLGRMPEMLYAVCVDKEGGLLEGRIEMERAFKSYDYDAAENYFLQMKECADDNVLTTQYLARAEALLDFYKNRIGAEELVQRLDEVLRMTVSEYEDYIGRTERGFPFVVEELLALMSLGQAYRYLGRCEKSIEIYETVLACLDKKYLAEPDNFSIRILVKESLTTIHEMHKRNEKALEEIHDNIRVAIENDYGHIMPRLLTGKAHNYIMLAGRGELSPKYSEDAKKYLRQAYYIAAARGDKEVITILMEYYKKHFGDWEKDFICNQECQKDLFRH